MSETYTPTYWNHNGRHQKVYDRLWKELVPASGPSTSEAGELLRAISKIYHDYYNNGFGNGPFRKQWELLQDYWGYIRRYVSDPKSLQIFAEAFASTNYGGEVVDGEEGEYYGEHDRGMSWDEPDPYDSHGPHVGVVPFDAEAEAAMDDIVDAVVLIADKIDAKEKEAQEGIEENVRRRTTLPRGARTARTCCRGR